MSKLILAIDPGTNCGWAVRDQEGRIVSGVWSLKGGRHEGGGMRFVRLAGYLSEILKTYPVEAVAYEEVRRHMGVDAAHIYGGVVATLTAACEARKPPLPYIGIPVGTIKKRATGKGNADKAAMCVATARLWPEMGPAEDIDDNEADARWIAVCAASELGGATDG